MAKAGAQKDPPQHDGSFFCNVATRLPTKNHVQILFHQFRFSSLPFLNRSARLGNSYPLRQFAGTVKDAERILCPLVGQYCIRWASFESVPGSFWLVGLKMVRDIFPKGSGEVPETANDFIKGGGAGGVAIGLSKIGKVILERLCPPYIFAIAQVPDQSFIGLHVIKPLHLFFGAFAQKLFCNCRKLGHGVFLGM